MQPTYITATSVGPSQWKVANWDIAPQQFSFAVLSSGGSSGVVEVTLEDPTRTYPNPNSSAPTAFSIGAWGSSVNTLIGLSSVPIAAYRLNVTTYAGGATITLATLQSGIG